MYTGFAYATRAGVSIGIDDMTIPDGRRRASWPRPKEVLEIQEQFLRAWSPPANATTRSSTSGRAPTNASPRR
jgi:hypothetical protein